MSKRSNIERPISAYLAELARDARRSARARPRALAVRPAPRPRPLKPAGA